MRGIAVKVAALAAMWSAKDGNGATPVPGDGDDDDGDENGPPAPS